MCDYCTTSAFREFSFVFTLDFIASNFHIHGFFFNLYMDIWKIKNEMKMKMVSQKMKLP